MKFSISIAALITLISSATLTAGSVYVPNSLKHRRSLNHGGHFKPFTRALHHTLAERASNASLSTNATSPLKDLMSILPKDCVSPCTPFYNDIQDCAKLPSSSAIAKCSCENDLLVKVQSCAACVATSSTANSSVSDQAIDDFNDFAKSCASAGLVSITGTLAASAVKAEATASDNAASKVVASVSSVAVAPTVNAAQAVNSASITIITGSTTNSTSASSTLIPSMGLGGLTLAVLGSLLC